MQLQAARAVRSRGGAIGALALLLPCLLLLSSLALLASPVAAQHWSPLFDGAPVLVTPTQRVSYFEIRLQSVFAQQKEAWGAIDAESAGPPLPPLVFAWTNMTGAAMDGSALDAADPAPWSSPVTPAMYVSFEEGSAPNATWNAFSSPSGGFIVVPPLAFLGQSYTVVAVDLGDAFQYGKSKFTMLAQLFQPMDLSQCYPQRFPFPVATTGSSAVTPAQFIVPGGVPPAKQADDWAVVLQVATPASSASSPRKHQPQQGQAQDASTYVSLTPPATADSAQWMAFNNAPLKIVANDPQWPGSGTFYVGVGAASQANGNGTFVLLTTGSSYCNSAVRKVAPATTTSELPLRRRHRSDVPTIALE